MSVKHAEHPRTLVCLFFWLIAVDCSWQWNLYSGRGPSLRDREAKTRLATLGGGEIIECLSLDLSCWALEHKHSRQTFCTIKVHTVLVSSLTSHGLMTQGFINVSSPAASLETVFLYFDICFDAEYYRMVVFGSWYQ